jgi:23S rRNA (cytidine1920-2'-O)/16S rRNA (cytidine1409-2'-O)-methyltransferase
VTAAKAKKERIDVLLVERGLCESRARAQARILAGDVVVNDHRIDKAGTKVSVDAEIRLKGAGIPDVSRGGLKLRKALELWPASLEDAVCLDVGASTGGFTDVLLKNGARTVYAVDVGHSQLHSSLVQDARVVNMEKTHIVHLDRDALDERPTVGVVDVSFISLLRVLPAMAALLDDDCRIYALIKPQFEVGKEHVKKGGIVRDEAARDAAVARVLACAEELGFVALGKAESPITGADGNVEVVCCLVRAHALDDTRVLEASSMDDEEQTA